MHQTEEFERNRSHLRSVAYRMLGSLTAADDAVQETWLRFHRVDADGVDDLRAWLTVIVSRVCLDMLRSRRARHEELVDGTLPELHVTLDADADPEREALMADSVGLALQLVLETLAPAERLAFVLHDTFGVPFQDIAPILERSVPATRQLASRARRRVRGAEPRVSTATPKQQRVLIDAFLAASRNGDFEALLGVLDPDVVMRVDQGGTSTLRELRGAADVARMVLAQGSPRAPFGRPALVDGSPGVVVVVRDRVIAVATFGVAGDRITAVDILTDPGKLRHVRV